jgi:hypothetical protein
MKELSSLPGGNQNEGLSLCDLGLRLRGLFLELSVRLLRKIVGNTRAAAKLDPARCEISVTRAAHAASSSEKRENR